MWIPKRSHHLQTSAFFLVVSHGLYIWFCFFVVLKFIFYLPDFLFVYFRFLYSCYVSVMFLFTQYSLNDCYDQGIYF